MANLKVAGGDICDASFRQEIARGIDKIFDLADYDTHSDTALGFSVSVSIRGALNICGAFIQSSVKQRALGCSRSKSHYLALLGDEQIRVVSIMTTLCWIWTVWSLYPLPHTEK